MSLKIGVITSTTRPIRVGPKVAAWFMDQVKNTPEMQFDLIDLAEVNLPFMDEPKSASSGEYIHEHTKKWSEKIANYDGFVWITAEYNHGPPAPLKNAIDSLHHEWGKKPVAFVGYGGMGATRAIEQLVQIAAQVHMMPLTATSLRVIDVWSAFDENDQLKPEFVRGHTEGFLQDLKWWGEALKVARTASEEAK